MTAINIFIQKDRALILTDSLFIDMWEGEPQFFADKCFLAPGTKMAVSARGDARVPEGVAADLPALYADIDLLIADRGMKVRELYENWVMSLGGDFDNAPIEIFVTGWSDRRDAPAVIVLHFGQKGWSFTEYTDEGVTGPVLTDFEFSRLRTLGVDLDGVTQETFDPIAHGIPLMEAQRRMKLPVGRSKPIHFVGGHILLTELRRDSYQQRVIHEWPDEEGMPLKVEPFGGSEGKVVMLNPPANMSRQQRRAWEREHGKITA